jgi:curved DNA-binding protein CbpA
MAGGVGHHRAVAMNFYVVLGVDEDADRDTIRSAFRGLVRRYHPDAGTGSSSTEFRRIVEAYETLSNPDRRRAHDRHLHLQRRNSSPRMRPVVEPLSNRVTVEPMVSRRFASGTSRPAVHVIDTDVDELFDALLRIVEAGMWSVRRPPY